MFCSSIHDERPESRTPARKPSKSPFQRLYLLEHAAVLIKEMHGAQDGAVAGLCADLLELRIELRFVDLAQDLLAEAARDAAHLLRDGGVFVGQIRVVRAGIEDAGRIAAVGKVKVDLFDDGLFGVRKVDEHEPADRRRHLVHEARGLSKIDVLGVLADLCNLDGRELVLKEQTV